MKKLMLLTLALFSFLATARTVKTGDAPLPDVQSVRLGPLETRHSLKKEYTMKKLMLLTLALFSFLATARTVKTGDAPFPTCNPCDWVR